MEQIDWEKEINGIKSVPSDCPQNQMIRKGKNKSWVTSIVPHDKKEHLKGNHQMKQL